MKNAEQVLDMIGELRGQAELLAAFQRDVHEQAPALSQAMSGEPEMTAGGKLLVIAAQIIQRQREQLASERLALAQTNAELTRVTNLVSEHTNRVDAILNGN